MFQGDIAQFAPADLLLFLCHMNKEGVLAVRQDEASLSLTFRRNLLVDGGCEATEDLVLDLLARQPATTPEAVAYLRQAREETGLPLSQIMADAPALAAADARQALAAGLRETVFRFLLWESGTFRFTELAVEDNPFVAPIDGPGLVMALTSEVDEYREVVRSLGALDRRLRVIVNPVAATAEERYVLTHALRATSVGDLVDDAPLPRLKTIAAVASAVEQGWVEFATAMTATATTAATKTATTKTTTGTTTTTATTGSSPGSAVASAGATPAPGVLAAYRQALRRLLQAGAEEDRYREVVSFAQTHCTQTILFGAQGGTLRRATVYQRDATGRLTASDFREPRLALADDAVFHQALVAGRPFVGGVFPSPVLAALGVTLPTADCALLPLGTLAGLDLLLYAVSTDRGSPTGPLACLELLSWQVHMPRLDRPATVDQPAVAAAGRATPVVAAADAADRLVASIRDLPPMPTILTRVLDVLARADVEMQDVADVLSHDPALVARLIKVSNSSLYGGYQETGSVTQAVLRLGMRATRSVVLAASTRALFPLDSSRRGLLGRALWEHAVRSGLAARRVAECTRRADPDEAFAAGVLHDIGKVVILLNRAEAYGEVQRRLERGAPDSITVEYEVLGFDHCRVGDLLLTNWSMPGNLRAVVRCHHHPPAAEDAASLVDVVACGQLLAHRIGDHAGAGSRFDERFAAACAALDLDGAACASVEASLRQDRDLGDLLD